MKPTSLRLVASRLRAALMAHPVEVVLSILYFTFAVITLNVDGKENRMWGTVLVFFPVVFAISYAFNRLFTEKPRAEYYVTLLLVVPLFVFHKAFGTLIDSVAYPITLLLALFLLLGFRRAPDNAAFARQNLQMVVDFVFAGIITLLLAGAIYLIYGSVEYIFDWRGWSLFEVYLACFAGFLVLPLTFCYLQDQSRRSELSELPRVGQVILNFVLSPAVIIYTLILYLYFFIIALRWELPKGGIAYMVMAFILVGILGRMAQLLVRRRYFAPFYRHFTYLAIPPLVLFWIGTLYRVQEYGLTEMRVYLLAAGVLVTLFVAFLPFRRLGRYRLMLAISAAVLVLLTYIPGMRASDIGLYSQEARLEQLARSLSLWDDAKGRIADIKESFRPADSLASYRSLRLEETYEYLAGRLGNEEALEKYGPNPFPYHYYLSDGTGPDYLVFSSTDRDIPVAGYRTCLKHITINLDGDLVRASDSSGRLLLEVSLAEHIAPYRAHLDTCRNSFLPDIRPFCLTNDTCMVVVDNLVRDTDGTYRVYEYGNGPAFLK